MLRLALGLALLSGLFAAPAAFAQEPGGTKVDITYKTRQFDDPAEAKAVYTRL